MDDTHLTGPVAHERDKTEQTLLIRMSRVAAYGMDFDANRVALMVEIHVTTALTIHLDGPAGCTFVPGSR